MTAADKELPDDYFDPEPPNHCRAVISRIILAIDTSGIPARILIAKVTEDNGQVTISPRDAKDFWSLQEFSRAWTWQPDRAAVVVPAEGPDPLRIREWLNNTGVSTEAYDWWGYQAHLRQDLTLRNVGLGPEYRRAYTLALYAGYRLHAAIICRSIWARLLETHELLADIRRDAHRLSAALDPSPPLFGEIPF